ncbi:MAG: DMT family transporter [Gammaproteobacteria bacterium]|jgi:drug/metabolite transporter (DMT)-like permease|nr:DMT family transporter [Gammaproteobacteria bacterium]|tara:strand:+ start:1305 stop:2216 length:912 start_codon:yes stop_codon:yes gene_type:complete
MADKPLVAIGLFSLAMMMFSATDGAAKYLSSDIAPQQIIFLRFVIVLILILLFCIYRGQWNILKTTQPTLQILRGLLLAVCSLIFYFALKHLPLELCAAIGFVSPLFVTALSIPFLGERVGLRRWIAVLIGLLSVLMILRPGGVSFQLAMLLPLGSSLCWAMALVLTRLMRGSEQALTVLAWSSLVGVAAVFPLVWPVWVTPNASQWTILILLGVFNGLGQYLVIRAFMLASASLLAPFSYSIIIWSMLIGLIIFNSFPDGITLVGTAILIAAGLYIWHREKVTNTPSTPIEATLGETLRDRT